VGISLPPTALCSETFSPRGGFAVFSTAAAKHPAPRYVHLQFNIGGSTRTTLTNSR
jgi:hypothetical protein